MDPRHAHRLAKLEEIGAGKQHFFRTQAARAKHLFAVDGVDKFLGGLHRRSSAVKRSISIVRYQNGMSTFQRLYLVELLMKVPHATGIFTSRPSSSRKSSSRCSGN